MSFQQFQLTKSVEQTRGIYDKYIYRPTNGDLIADCLGANYFDLSRFADDEDWIGSIVEMLCTDGWAIAEIVEGGTIALYDSTNPGGGTTEWGTITGTITSQADLQAQFNDTKSDAVIIINSLDDLNEKAPVVSGRHQFSPGVLYEFGASVTTNFGFAPGAGTGFTCRNLGGPVVAYTGTDPMFDFDSTSLFMFQFVFACPNADIFDFKNTSGTGAILGISQTTCAACQAVGAVDDAEQIFIDTFNVLSCESGLSLSGVTNWQILTIFRMSMDTTNAAFVGIDYGTSLHKTLEIDNLVINGVLGGLAFSGSAGSANVSSPNVATISSCEISSAVTILGGGLDQNDVGFDYRNISGGDSPLVNSKVLGHCYITASQTTTTISGTEVQIAGTYTQGAETSQASTDASGNINMLNRVARRGDVQTKIDVDKIGGGQDDYIFRIKKDVGGAGTTIEDVDGAFTTITLSGGGSDQVSIFGPTTFIDSDRYFVTVEAVGTNDDIVAVTQGFEVSE